MSPCSAGAVKLATLQNNNQRKWIVVFMLQQGLFLCGAISKTKRLDPCAILMKSGVHKWKITREVFSFFFGRHTFALLFQKYSTLYRYDCLESSRRNNHY